MPPIEENTPPARELEAADAPAPPPGRATARARLGAVAGHVRPLVLFLWLLGAAAAIAVAGHGHYPIQHWLFWRYAAYWLACAFWGAGCLSAGHAVVARLLRVRLPFLEHLAVSFAAGVFVFFLGMFVAGLLRLYHPATFFLLPALMIASGGPSALRLARRARSHRALWPRPRVSGSRHGPLLLALCLGFGLLALGAVYFLILTPENVQFDSRWKHLALGEDYAAYGGIRRHPEGWTVATYPHLASFVYAWPFLSPFGQIFDRVEIAAHMEFLGFLSTLLSVSALSRRLVPRVPAHLAWVARFLFPGVLLYDSSLSVGGDHIAAIFVGPAYLALLRAWEDLAPKKCVLVSLLLAGAILVKYTSLIMVLPVVGGAVALRAVWLGVRALRGQGGGKAWLLGPLAALGAGLLVTAPHWALNIAYYGDPLYPSLHAHLTPRPFTEDAADLFEWGYKDYQFWSPTRDLAGLRETAKATLKFSFEPNDWPRFHRDVPVFGFLFTLLLPCLLLFRLRSTARIWALAAGVHLSVFCWYWTHHQDRYLQTILPWMAAVVAAVIALVWRSGRLGRAGLALLVGLQVVWGGDVYFFQTHAMIKSPIKAVVDLLSAGHERNYEGRLRVYRDWVDAGASMPKGAMALLHDNHNHLGLGRPSASDWGGWQFGLSYGRLRSAREVYEKLRAMDVTHLVWEAQVSKGWDSIAGDVRFFEFALNHAENRKRFGKLLVAEMPEAPPPEPEGPERVLFLGCRGTYASGLYDLSAMTTPVFGPKSRRFPKPLRPLPPEGDPGALAGEAMAMIVDRRCHKDARPGPDFVLAARRLVVGKGVRGRPKVEIWIRSEREEPSKRPRPPGGVDDDDDDDEDDDDGK